ncbi:ankyrin repeat domain-containing protein 6-like isoform X1 [Acanthaster planci]|uniref:Ankyrin repeat domain-containing protein 6-like isoform X1 n=1 Tax=Acanthaster planci TaxID=133434 RepID=A0A8B7ZBS3_ACAPL|nr:ankyrin repeat domain-containing protein 6-like isoform X1 [Acanthaster planci]XP_022100670.1 ankyrin repeat domain-containing protein 6-like isoform X1 [Acanthaster planci]XP_022100671.1 ankyrin repeat domain-containing protein 6-like isoform X1 [Acanthaster planci]
MAQQTAQLSERLRLAASKGEVSYIRELAQSGAGFTADKYGRTALHYAANYGQAEAVKLCVHLGCDLDAQDVYGCTALHRAAIDNHTDAVRALLLEGCAVDRQDENGNTALHEATWTGYDEIVVALVKQGKANLHASNKYGNKPLHQSCQNGHSETTRILLRAGSHPNIKNNNGETALHIAALFGHITCCRILVSANSNVNITNSEGNTALHVAAGLGKKKISKILIEASTDLSISNNNGETALEIARKNDHADVVMLILAAIKLQKSKSSNHHHHHHHNKTPHKPPAAGQDRPEATQQHHRHKQDAEVADASKPDEARVRGRRELREQERKESQERAAASHQHKKDGEERKKKSGKPSALAKKPILATNQSQRTTSHKQVTFVKEELRNAVLWEKQLHQQIHSVKFEDVDGKGHHHRHKHHQKCLYKDDKGNVTKGTTTSYCTCSIYIHKLQNQLEASKEKMLYEIDTTRAQFEHQLVSLDKKLTHQGSCLDQLCKERVASEHTECLHRIDRRILQERALWSEEYERRLSYVREELRRYFEVRLRTVQQQLAVYYPSDERQPLHGNPSGFERISEGTEDSSGSDPNTRQRVKAEIVGPSGRMIARRRPSPNPGHSTRVASADGRLTHSNHPRQNGILNHHVNGEQSHDAYQSNYTEDNRGRSRMVMRGPPPRGRRTSSFTRAVQHQNASASPGHPKDDHSGKELVSATYIPPIAHPDLPQSSKPREPESAVVAASFNFKTDSSGEESSSSSTISLKTVSRRPVRANHSDTQVQGSECTSEAPHASDNRPFQRLSKIALEQKAQFESQQGHHTKASGHSQEAVRQQPVSASSWQKSAYRIPADVTAQSLPSNPQSNQTSPDSNSPSSSQYSPNQCGYSNSSSGVSSGDAATASSIRTRRNPIDDVLIRAFAMERERQTMRKSNNRPGTARADFPKSTEDSKPSAYVKGFARADLSQSDSLQVTPSRKTHELQI